MTYGVEVPHRKGVDMEKIDTKKNSADVFCSIRENIKLKPLESGRTGKIIWRIDGLGTLLDFAMVLEVEFTQVKL